MLDRAAAYKTSQILTASPVERVVLLYRGAIRFASVQAAEADHGDRAAAHVASLRAQEIVAALRESLDLSAGPLADQLDGLYAFCLRRLVDGNVRGASASVREAIQVLQGLLDAWVQISGAPAPAPTQTLPAPGPTVPAPIAAAMAGGGAAAYGRTLR